MREPWTSQATRYLKHNPKLPALPQERRREMARTFLINRGCPYSKVDEHADAAMSAAFPWETE